MRCHARGRFHTDEARLQADVRALVDHHEAGRPESWQVDDMGERYEQLSQGIIGFEADVTDVLGRFKLGQDERDDVYLDIMRGLAGEPGGSPDLLDWMRMFNPLRDV